MTDQAIWLIWSNEHGRWWRPGWSGYCSTIAEAGRYPKAVADEICKDANFGGMVNEVAVLAPEFGLPVDPPAPPDPSPAVFGDDLRQGVSPAGHAVLDALDKFRAADPSTADELLNRVRRHAREAYLSPVEDYRRETMTCAGALAILALERLEKVEPE